MTVAHITPAQLEALDTETLRNYLDALPEVVYAVELGHMVVTATGAELTEELAARRAQHDAPLIDGESHDATDQGNSTDFTVVTGYEHVPTHGLKEIFQSLTAATPSNVAHAKDIAEDLDHLNAEIARRV